MSRCDRWGHKYRPRFDDTKTWPLGFRAESIRGEFREERKLYVCDICERCGATVPRPPRPQEAT